MSSKMPPVPPGNRSPMGPGDQAQAQADGGPGGVGSAKSNPPDKVGQTANTRVNTTHQGLQQDR